MEKLKMENLEEKSLINELSQGKELAMQLMNNLQQSSSQEKRDFLVGQILSSYEKVLSMIDQANHKEPKTSLESPRSVIFDPETKTPRDTLKKRKIMPRWPEQVKVCFGTGIEGPIEDGYSWRKYGQKDILGSSHPRGYFRCTHRNSQGCLATKQVQRSDQDSSILEVTYRGKHTCNIQSSQPPIAIKEQKEDIINPTQSSLLNLKTGLAVITEELDSKKSNIFPPFSFSSAPIEYSYDAMGDLFLSAGGLSPAFSSPVDSPWHVGAFGECKNSNDQTSESDLTEILSAPTSVTNLPMGDYLHFPFDNMDFELSFSDEFFS